MVQEILVIGGNNTTNSVTAGHGHKILVNQKGVKLVSVTKYSNSTATVCKLYERTGVGTGNLIATGSVSGNVATFNILLKDGIRYFIVWDAAGGAFTLSRDNTPSFPYTGKRITSEGSTNFAAATEYTSVAENIDNILVEDFFGRGFPDYLAFQGKNVEGDVKIDWDFLVNNGTLVGNSLAAGTGTNTLYTVPAGKITYINTASMSARMDAPTTVREAQMVVAGKTIFHHTLPNVANDHVDVVISFPIPIKMVIGNTVQLISSNPEIVHSGSFTGYEVDA